MQLRLIDNMLRMNVRSGVLSSCRKASELMSQKMEQPLSWRERVSLSVHLAMCTGCRRAQRQMQFLRQASREWTKREM